jgi:hypothetical protein
MAKSVSRRWGIVIACTPHILPGLYHNPDLLDDHEARITGFDHLPSDEAGASRMPEPMSVVSEFLCGDLLESFATTLAA